MSILPIVAHILAQPWAWPALIGIGAFLLGLLIPRRNNASWLSGIILFLPYLFLDFLDMVHTKKFKYYGLVTALLAIEAFFAFRAATVYYDVLNAHMPLPEMAIVCVIVFIAVFLCGYMVATHGKLTFWSFCTMLFVVFHDWAGTIWMNYSQPILSVTGTVTAASTSDQANNDGLKLVLTIGMCLLGILPFIMGAWAEELRPQLEKELEEEVNTFTGKATRQIKRRAVNRVLRLTNRTDIVRLVRALPAEEFSTFQKFVLPIIDPSNEREDNEASESGQSLHLPLASRVPQTGQQATNQPATPDARDQNQLANQPYTAPDTGHSANRANRTPQPDDSMLATLTTGHQARPATSSGQDTSGHIQTLANPTPGTTHRPASLDTTGPDKLELTVSYLSAHPHATDEELAVHLGLSRPASALFYRRKAFEILGWDQSARTRPGPARQSPNLGMIERMMYEAILKAEPAQQAELRALGASQTLAEFTRTLQQRYPQYAAHISETRVAAVLAYDREHQPAMAASPTQEFPAMRTSHTAGQTEQDSAARQADNPPPANRTADTGHAEATSATEKGSGQPANVIAIADHRIPRPAGQDSTEALPPDSAPDHQEDSEEPARGQPDNGVRIAAYRQTHQDATQKQVGEALGLSERTVRRHWKPNNVAAS